ncbi:MAG: putative lipid II flippase FtsW [Candidatus Vogelbacteria bacterium]|nr:putative lipid II flippase FtsW [Candidatus Vogelbacteria bacterium]
MVKPRADKFFFLIVVIILTLGYVIFFSASQSLLSRNDAADFSLVAGKQFLILFVGLIALIISANIPYKNYRRFAFWIFLGSVLLNLLVFLPSIGFGAGGAKRWIDLGGPLSFQPSEFLKFGFVAYAAYWLAAEKDHISSFMRGILPFLAILGIPAIILIKEPDTGTFMVLFVTALAMLFASGARLKHLLILVLASVLAIGILAAWKPYVRHRLETFINPAQDMLGSSYQINQSLIAIGSGGLYGRGFGQSIQKFNYLPEAIGDSIFAVMAEEFGLLGCMVLILCFAIFTVWGLRIASRVSDQYGRLLAVGLVILIAAQAFINIASMLGLIPLTGVPLTFVSHGGSALIIAMIEIGIVLNISRHQTR